MTTTDIEMPPPARIGVGRPGPSYEEAAQVMRASGLEPLCIYPGSATPWPSRCMECKEVVRPRYSHVKAGASRGYCGCSKAKQKEIRTDPVEAFRVMRAAGLEPFAEFPGANDPWECLCLACEETVTPRFSHVRDGRSSGCKFCAGVALTEAQAVTVMELANLEPLEPYPGNNKAPWLVRCGECEWCGTTTYAQARVLGNGCRRCGGHTFDPEEMAQMMRDAGFEPLIPYPGLNKSWPCVCDTCGHRTNKTAAAVRSGAGCMRCAGKILLAEEAAERITAMGFLPSEPYPGRNSARWRCVCAGCDANVRVTYKDIMRGQGAGCCNGLLDFRRPGRSMGLYLITHPTLSAAKIGVGVTTYGRMPRLEKHLYVGWRVEAAWSGISDPVVAFDIERSVINEWRRAGLPAFVDPRDMPQHGHTETVELSRIDLAGCVARVEGALIAAGVTALPIVPLS